MEPFREIAEALARLVSESGGAPEERAAIAHLVLALFHVRFVDLKKALRGKNFNATTYEDTCSVTLSVDGCSIKVERFSGRDTLCVEFSGFDPSVVSPKTRSQDLPMSWTSVENVTNIVFKIVVGIKELLLQERAVRSFQRSC